AEPGAEGRGQPAVGGDGASEGREARALARGQAADRPALVRGDLGQRRVRVYGAGMAHGPQEVDVLAAVAVRVADLEVDARLAREAPHRGGLAGSPQDRALDAAREDVPHPLEPRAQDVLDAQLAR